MVTQTPDGWTEFRFYRPELESVVLTGEFNGWHRSSLPMTRGDDGWWRYRVRLAPGCYQFRYLGDDEWYTDYAAFGIEPTPLGINSVVRVEPPPMEAVTLSYATRPAPVVRLGDDSDHDPLDFDPVIRPEADRPAAERELKLEAVPA